jgi:nitroreductase
MNSENFIQLIEQRQSVRAYSNLPVEKEKILRCIESARLAPSASNAQPWKYIVIDNPELKEKVAKLTYSNIVSFNRFTHQAPVLVIVVRERANFMSTVGQTLKNNEFPLIDIGISAIQFCLQATAEGLGTCIMGWFSEKKLKQLLNIPRNKAIALVISLGYPASDEIRTKRRKEINEILSFNGY